MPTGSAMKQVRKWSRIPKHYPSLKIALSEGGTGWIPYFLDRLDRTYDMHRAWTGQDFADRLPSDVFREHFLTCFIVDDVGLQLRDKIGLDNIAWECDYPHSDSTWPDAPEQLHASLGRAGVPDDEIDKITFQNAMRWFHYDPLSARGGRESCTVGYLRTHEPVNDTTVRAFDTGRVERTHSGVDLGKLAKSATA